MRATIANAIWKHVDELRLCPLCSSRPSSLRPRYHLRCPCRAEPAQMFAVTAAARHPAPQSPGWRCTRRVPSTLRSVGRERHDLRAGCARGAAVASPEPANGTHASGLATTVHRLTTTSVRHRLLIDTTSPARARVPGHDLHRVQLVSTARPARRATGSVRVDSSRRARRRPDADSLRLGGCTPLTHAPSRAAAEDGAPLLAVVPFTGAVGAHDASVTCTVPATSS